MFPKWSISTKDWGNPAWRLLHYLSFCFPDEPTVQDRENYQQFIHSFQRVIPCGSCRKHFKHLLKEHPVDVRSRDQFIQWAIRIHNLVNQRLKKPIMTEEQVVEEYSRPNDSSWFIGAGVMLMGLLQLF